MCWLITALAFAAGFTLGGFAHALVAVVLWRKLIGNVIRGEVERVRSRNGDGGDLDGVADRDDRVGSAPVERQEPGLAVTKEKPQ